MLQNEAAGTTITILVGTSNRHKVEEIRAVLSDLPLAGQRTISVVGAETLPPAPPVEEDGATFEENAILKARTFAVRSMALPVPPALVLADDSGLCVDALYGAPGIRSARYAGEGAGDRENNRKLLQALQGVPQDRRGAEFVCTIACAALQDGALRGGRSRVEAAAGQGASPGNRPPASRPEDAVEILFVARGRCRGEILTELRGTGGFGYDPLFLFPQLGKTFAELSGEEKNRWSHRGRALASLHDWLCGLLRGDAAGGAPARAESRGEERS